MDVDPAVGKILGMVMAYAVSALGLLLAYYNYRTRVVKAEQVFTPVARAVLWIVGLLATFGIVVAAAALNRAAGETSAQAVVRQAPGILVPGVVFALSFWITWALYKRFSRATKHKA